VNLKKFINFSSCQNKLVQYSFDCYMLKSKNANFYYRIAHAHGVKDTIQVDYRFNYHLIVCHHHLQEINSSSVDIISGSSFLKSVEI